MEELWRFRIAEYYCYSFSPEGGLHFYRPLCLIILSILFLLYYFHGFNFFIPLLLITCLYLCSDNYVHQMSIAFLYVFYLVVSRWLFRTFLWPTVQRGYTHKPFCTLVIVYPWKIKAKNGYSWLSKKDIYW